VTQLFKEAGEKTGQTFEIGNKMRKEIEQTGFVNIIERVFKVPFGPWPSDPKLKELGRWTLLSFDTGLEGYVLATLTRALGVSTWPSDVETLLFSNLETRT